MPKTWIFFKKYVQNSSHRWLSDKENFYASVVCAIRPLFARLRPLSVSITGLPLIPPPPYQNRESATKVRRTAMRHRLKGISTYGLYNVHIRETSIRLHFSKDCGTNHYYSPAKAREYVLPALVCLCVCLWPR